MLENIASTVSKEGSDNEEIQGDISYNLENSQTMIDAAIDSASDMIDKCWKR